VPLIFGSECDSDEEAGPISHINDNKRNRKRNQRHSLLAAGVVVIILLLTVILAMCYVLLTRSNSATTTTTPAVQGMEGITTTKRAEEYHGRQTPNWNVTFRDIGTSTIYVCL
jgi:cytoskeletal protein RodZ